MTYEEQAQYFAGCHNRFQHYWDDDATCIFCGAFGPIEEFDPCISRDDIGAAMVRVQQIIRGMGVEREVVERLQASRKAQDNVGKDAAHRPERQLEIHRCRFRFDRISPVKEE